MFPKYFHVALIKGRHKPSLQETRYLFVLLENKWTVTKIHIYQKKIVWDTHGEHYGTQFWVLNKTHLEN